MTGDLISRAMSRDDLDTAIGWAADEGWNPGIDDGDAFFAADNGGFIGTWLDGQLIACISAIRYGADYGFIGFYLCHPDHRGKGYGWRTWEAGMAYLKGRVVGLDGVVDQQANYRASGFELSQRNIRYGGEVGALPRDKRLQPIDGSLIEAVAAYDAAFFPADRAAFLQQVGRARGDAERICPGRRQCP